MIRKELFKTRSDEVKLYRTYSDEDYRILQVETGQVFDEAIDVETSNYTYEETEEKTETKATEQDYIEALNELGVDTNEEE